MKDLDFSVFEVEVETSKMLNKMKHTAKDSIDVDNDALQCVFITPVQTHYPTNIFMFLFVDNDNNEHEVFVGEDLKIYDLNKEGLKL